VALEPSAVADKFGDICDIEFTPRETGLNLRAGFEFNGNSQSVNGLAPRIFRANGSRADSHHSHWLIASAKKQLALVTHNWFHSIELMVNC
jgi:hypothetical protein